MKRLVVGGLALGFTAVGTLALGGPAGAQEDPGEPEIVELQGQLSADSVAPGESVTASSVDPCTVPEEGDPGSLYWAVWNTDTGLDALEDEAALEADGSWSVEFQAPDEAGNYQFVAVCLPSDLPAGEEELQELEAEGLEALGGEGEEPPPEEPEGEEPFVYEVYYLDFAVDGGDGPPVTEPPADTPAPPVAAPAMPVVGQPTFTG